MFPETFPFFFSKWANNSPILRKKWENFGEKWENFWKQTKISRNVLAIFPSVGILYEFLSYDVAYCR